MFVYLKPHCRFAVVTRHVPSEFSDSVYLSLGLRNLLLESVMRLSRLGKTSFEEDSPHDPDLQDCISHVRNILFQHELIEGCTLKGSLHVSKLRVAVAQPACSYH